MKAAASLALLLILASTVSAGHLQEEGDKEVTFEHKTGNEWWVEVVLGGPGEASVTGVDAQDTDGDWVALEKKSWGAWAASFHIEPGHLVQFRAHVDGEADKSCWFSHPEGVAQCSADWTAHEIEAVLGRGLTMNDVDQDGAPELVGTGNSIDILGHTTQGWTHEGSIQTSEMWAIDAGDLDGDGAPELASTFPTGPFLASEVTVFDRVDGEWVQRQLPSNPDDRGDITIGDITGDGQSNGYIGGEGTIWRLQEESDGNYAETSLTTPGHQHHLWIGDADGDGDNDLLIGAGSFDGDLYVGDFEPGWTTQRIGGDFDGETAGVAIGDADGDGNPKSYVARTSPPGLWQARHDGTWTTDQVVSFTGKGVPAEMFLGDTDGDGRDELYVATEVDRQHVRLYEVAYEDGAWQTTLVHTVEARLAFSIIIGDGDEDGTKEVFLSTNGGPTVELSRRPGSDPGPDDAAFDSRNGNEWWVQVHVSGAEPSRVQAMDTGDPWVELELKDWGDWARSFHVEPGHDVRFRALIDGEWVTSCWFTHPEGERTTDCPDSEPPPPSDFDASFDTPGGNEWWVEVYVDVNEPLAGVDARADGGAWVALEKKDWGAWAKSFHVEDGSIVEFRATSTDGDTDVSQGYRWPSGEPA